MKFPDILVCRGWMLRVLVPGILAVASLLPSVAEEAPGIPAGTFMTKAVVQTADDELYRLVDGMKRNPEAAAGVGMSLKPPWAELVLKPAEPKSESPSFFTITLLQEWGEENHRIHYADLTETTASGTQLEEVRHGTFSSPKLIQALADRAVLEFFNQRGTSLMGSQREICNYAFRTSWEDPDLFARMKLLAKDPQKISHSAFKELEWAHVEIGGGAPEDGKWRLGMLADGKFNLYGLADRTTESRWTYFGEIAAKEIWGEIARRIRAESPEIRKSIADRYEGALESDLKVNISALSSGSLPGMQFPVVTTVENTSRDPIGILLRDTPFDAITAGKAFSTIYLEKGEDASLKQSHSTNEQKTETDEDYAIIFPGEILSGVLDLGDYYQMDSQSTYEIRHEFQLKSYEVIDGKVARDRLREDAEIHSRGIQLKRPRK